MKRSSSFGNSIGTVTVLFEGYGAKKHELGNDEFGEWLDHQSDFASLVLTGFLAGLTQATTGSRTAQTSFEVEQDGTTVSVNIELKLWKSVDPDAIDRLMDSLATGIKSHVRKHLKPAVDDSAFESWARMDGGESLHDVAARLVGVGPLSSVLADLFRNRSGWPFDDLRIDPERFDVTQHGWPLPGDFGGGLGGFPPGYGPAPRH